MLPVTMGELGGEGALVARSAGLASIYARLTPTAEHATATTAHAVAHRIRQRRTDRDLALCSRSYVTADLTICLNADERAELHAMREGRPVWQTVIGVHQDHLERLQLAALPSATRLKHRWVTFVGYWSARKGARDWPAILRETWRNAPDVRFRFLGTGLSDRQLHAALGLETAELERIENQRRFSPDELPDLIADCAAAVLPSYVEAYGIATVEAAAAGVPTVVYDTVGTRVFSQQVDPTLVVPAGDVCAVAQRLVALLDEEPTRYAELALRCTELAMTHSWNVLAPLTRDAYARALTVRD
jgi:glycosyltransferase involved in cell wall biosynthesis